MSAGINLLFSNGGGTLVNHKIFIQEEMPSVNEGLWVKSSVVPSSIESVLLKEISPRFNEIWETEVLPTGYQSFAVVGDFIYLIGNSNGTYQKADLRQSPLSFISYDAGCSELFTSSTVIGDTVYATKDGSTLQVYQMNTSDPLPSFQLVLPEQALFSNPRICSYGTKIYALMGASTGTKLVSVIDTADSSPSWTALPTLSEDSSKSSLIALNNFLYVVGMLSTGYKCYALDLNSPSAWQIAAGFVSQGTYYGGLSTVGGILRVINCGYAVMDRNCVSLINGLWLKASQTDLPLLSVASASYTRVYHTDYGVYVKDKSTDNLFILRRSRPVMNFSDNTLILVKGEVDKASLTAEINNYTIKEPIISCYHLTVPGGEEVLTKVPIALYNTSSAIWEDIIEKGD